MADVVIDIEAAARALDREPALEILRWASAQVPRLPHPSGAVAVGDAAASRQGSLGPIAGDSARVPRLTFATGFGAEGCVIIDLIGRHQLPIDIFTLDTGVLFAETYTLWKQLENKYGITIRGVTPAQTLDEQAAAYGPKLWEREPDRCCDLRKVQPLRNALAGFSGWITAIRRDQTPERATAQVVETDRKFGLIKINPLVTWTHDDVWGHLYAHDVPTNPLHDRGYPSIGCEPCTSPVVPGENLRAGRWRGSAKKECGLHVQEEKER